MAVDGNKWLFSWVSRWISHSTNLLKNANSFRNQQDQWWSLWVTELFTQQIHLKLCWLKIFKIVLYWGLKRRYLCCLETCNNFTLVLFGILFQTLFSLNLFFGLLYKNIYTLADVHFKLLTLTLFSSTGQNAQHCLKDMCSLM